MKALPTPIGLLMLLALVACKQDSPPPAARQAAQPAQQAKAPPATGSQGKVTVPEAHTALFRPLPERFESENNPITPQKVALGRQLFYEKRLSKSHQISCNSCHDLKNYGVDNQQFSTGHKQQKGGRNSPTVYNAAYHVAQFWDGRAADVEEQAKGPILNPIEMAAPDEAFVVKTLKSIPGYVEGFKKAFPNDDDPVTYDNMAKAIGAFERQLITPSRWDRFLKGDAEALTNAEKAGFNRFVTTGCITCHTGPYVGGHIYQKLGLVKPWPDIQDTGRFEITKKEEEKYFFKVPGLRNIEKTGPYLHDGSIGELKQVVSMMAEHQLGKTLTDEETASIITFLKSMTGEIPRDYIREPQLPPSGPQTPEPDLQ